MAYVITLVFIYDILLGSIVWICTIGLVAFSPVVSHSSRADYEYDNYASI